MVLLTLTLSAHAEKKPESVYMNIKESSQVAEAKRLVLFNLQKEMSIKFDEIESMIAVGNSKAALGAAKEVLDTVRVKTGIDPKTRIQENFLVPLKFPAGVVSMTQLPEDQRNTVIRVISEFRAGLYMDIMNLSKRTTLLYIKAFEAQLKKSGGLNTEDKKKIVNDLVKATLVPMVVEDKSGKKIIAFDEDIANEDHTYLFNRELKMFIYERPELGVDERNNGFETLRASTKAALLKSLAPTQPAASQPTYEKALACMANTNGILYNDDKNGARVSCFNKHYRSLTSIVHCQVLASYILYNDMKNSAQKACTSKFNQ